MEQQNTYFRFGKQVGYVIATNVIGVIIGIIQMPILTKALGTTQYGMWSIISLAISFITPFAMLSFSMSIVRFLAAEKDLSKIREDFFSACTLVIISGTIFSLLLFIFSDFLAGAIFKDPNSASYFRLSSILVLLNSIFPVLLAFFRRGSKIGIFNTLGLCLNVFQVGLIILFVSIGYSLTGVIWAAIISTLLLVLVAGTIIWKQIGFQRPKFTHMKSYLKWGIPLTPNSAIGWLISSSDRYIISSFLGVSAAGIYSAAYGIGVFASFALMPVGIVLYPMVSKAYDEKNLDECSNLFTYSIKYLMMLSIPAAAGLSILANPLLRVLTTPDFVPGSSVVSLVAFGALFSCFAQIGGYVIHLVGKTQITVRILVISAAINFALNFLLVPYMGIMGSGLASLIAYGAFGIITYKITRKYLHYDLNPLFILKSLISAGIMVLVIWFIKPESLAMIVVSTVIGSIIYFGMLILIKGISKTELSFFITFLRNFMKMRS
jgi:O-antigen/teichoic acid export membrane protein